MTFIFGLIISFICPVLFGIQNFVFGMILTNGRLSRITLYHILKTINHQLVVIYDLSLFDTKIGGQENQGFRRALKLAIGYLGYILPCTLIGYLFLFVRSSECICEKMNAQFLLNNSYSPHRISNELYEARVAYYYKNVSNKCKVSGPGSGQHPDLAIRRFAGHFARKHLTHPSVPGQISTARADPENFQPPVRTLKIFTRTPVKKFSPAGPDPVLRPGLYPHPQMKRVDSASTRHFDTGSVLAEYLSKCGVESLCTQTTPAQAQFSITNVL